ncbi:MAG: SDR family NAD(P)-dependent oxidoreductase [Eubacterium sp.]|nr:SDR family NAD(P)-dependent oxidoreductase [Eubacterium sp.]
MDIVWWLRNFFGNVFVLFVIVSIILVYVTALLAKKKAPDRDDEKRIALVTGASSGLGNAYARQIAVTEKGIEEIWLVARRADRLEAFSNQLKQMGMPAKVLALDLTDDISYARLEEELKKEQVRIGLLIVCAGYAKIGNYERVSRFDSGHMIDLNCKAAVDTTLVALPFMKAGDRIMEVCSTAAFQPLQHMNIYAASKAFLYNYTRGLRMELLPRRIKVTAVCPYWIKDTEFISVAKDDEQMVHGHSAVRHFPFSTKAEPVAKRSLRASRIGRAVATPGIFCIVHRIFAKLISREAAMYIWEGMRRI